jgi:hypothetical protein
VNKQEISSTCFVAFVGIIQSLKQLSILKDGRVLKCSVAAESPSTSPPTPQKSYTKFGTLGQLLKIPPFVRPNIS